MPHVSPIPLYHISFTSSNHPPLLPPPPSCIFLSIQFFNRSLLPPSDLSIEFDAFIKTTHSIKSLEMSLI